MTRETAWIRVEEKELSKLLKERKKDNIIYSAKVSLDSLNLSFNIGTNNIDSLEILSNFFKLEKINTDLPEIIQLENTDYNNPAFLLPKIPAIETPFLGIVDQNYRNCLVLGKGSGLLKSLTVGFASALAQNRCYHPIHASLLKIKNQGVILTGSHNAGKTSSLLNLVALAEADNFGVLTDDWALINEDSEQAINLEHTISFDQDYYTLFNYLNLEEKIASLSLRGFFDEQNYSPLLYRLIKDSIKSKEGKINISVEALFGGIHKLNRMKIDEIVLLNPANRKNLIEEVNLEEKAKQIVENTYHMPDIDPNLKVMHENFWVEFMKKRKVYSFDTRNKIGPEKSHRELYKFIGSKNGL